MMSTDEYILRKIEKDIRDNLKANLLERALTPLREELEEAIREVVDNLSMGALTYMSPMSMQTEIHLDIKV